MTSLHQGIAVDAPAAALVSRCRRDIAAIADLLVVHLSCKRHRYMKPEFFKVPQYSLYPSLPSRIFPHAYLSDPFRFPYFESRMRLAFAHYTRYEIHASADLNG